MRKRWNLGIPTNYTVKRRFGKFTFKQLKEAGVYHICEVLKPGWTQQVQTWSGSGYGVNTTNLSGATDEGTYCTTTTYDDSGDRSSKHNFGNVDTTKPITTILGPSDGGFTMVD